MGYPAAYLHDEKKFLHDVFNRHADIKGAFAACEDVYPPDRLDSLREAMTRHPRYIWRNLGIPDTQCETLADHAGHMALLSYRHPVRGHDVQMVRDMIDAWAIPLTVADEIPLEDMNKEDRHLLRSLAARLAFDDYTVRDQWKTWDNLAALVYDESLWVHDIDHIATARQAHDYKAAFPHLHKALDSVIHCCRHSLLTEQGRTVFKSALDPAHSPAPVRPRLAA